MRVCKLGKIVFWMNIEPLADVKTNLSAYVDQGRERIIGRGSLVKSGSIKAGPPSPKAVSRYRYGQVKKNVID